jgi:phosphoglycolate phosphatase
MPCSSSSATRRTRERRIAASSARARASSCGARCLRRSIRERPRGSSTTRSRATRARYRAHLVDETRPYEGIVELIAALRARGALLAVVTNKPHDAALEVVERLFEPGTFEVVLGQKDGVPHKPDPSGPLSILRALAVAPAHALFVGDSETDVRTAKNAGVRAVAVTWGLRDRHDLEASGPDHLVDHPREILALLEA